ncbi:protein of unknown function [Burkholderia multivorans]
MRSSTSSTSSSPTIRFPSHEGRARGNQLIEAGLVDMVASGRPFIANPDPPARFRHRCAACRSRLTEGLRPDCRGLYGLSRPSDALASHTPMMQRSLRLT